MLKTLLLLTFLSCSAFAINSPYFNLDYDHHLEWREWKLKYNKTYGSYDEDVERFAIWIKNMKKIVLHNMGHNFKLDMNHLGDMTEEEYQRYASGIKQPIPSYTSNYLLMSEKLPESVDWRQKGAVFSVRQQGSCGSCWSFSSVEVVEGFHALKTGHLIELSPQQLVDCVKKDNGCGGGLPVDAYDYLLSVGGLEDEKDYPYVAEDEPCAFNKSDIVANFSSYKVLPQGDEDQLKQAVATISPISIAIDASQFSFQMYSGGVYDEPNCGNKPENLDHAVLLVGYGSDHGQDYWLVKNSWGTGWGEDGYIRMSRNKNNQCGIATMASYVE